MIATDQVSRIFVEMADTLVTDFDLVDFLYGLATSAVTVTGADAAGILLAGHDGHLRFMAASSEQATLLEIFQANSEQGPCQDSYRSGAPVVNLDLSDTAKWPDFAPKAVELGYESVHALPLRLRDQRIGALNLFGGTGMRLDESGIAIAQAFADVATIGILQERAIRRSEVLTEQLHGALTSRIIIEQAKGALAQAGQVSTDRAFLLLRSYARSHRLHLTEVCDRAVNDRDMLAALAGLAEFTEPTKPTEPSTPASTSAPMPPATPGTGHPAG
ncbi:GAF and ANTAR domain-containing protein [Pseudactinotalea sp. HY158]|uniref:GAF and ANTAR domain-containing protein n=1 Tax=Pseudactinotalea sp. HY158 TaxID=2654547 RepID=UPI00129CD8D6|nr:GAF and ANTAR domain-containing protein [Pseudactinotalea sp. HY158]QGH70597.1 ANTAR domain-containing protein [Pseudactinotalea sp. HY158]